MAENGLMEELSVSVELYVPPEVTSLLRKPHNSKKWHDDSKKVKEKGSWMNLPRNAPKEAHWRPVLCTMYEEQGGRCLLNIYLDESMRMQTVNVHLLHHTGIRVADSSLFQRNYVVGIHCNHRSQRWTSVKLTEPIYLAFPRQDVMHDWIMLLRSYAENETYGRQAFPNEGGLYRMWRRVELVIPSCRNIGSAKPFTEPQQFGGPAELDDANDLDLYCEVKINDVTSGRTSVCRSIGHPDWTEKFAFTDLPPFLTLKIDVIQEKKFGKPTIVGTVTIALGNIRRGKIVDGWFPVLQAGAHHAGLHNGDMRVVLRVDEEIILPMAAYDDLLQCIMSRNLISWQNDLKRKLGLETIMDELIVLAAARDVLTDQIFEAAESEINSLGSTPSMVFRTGTNFTTTMQAMLKKYGGDWLEASIGDNVRRICAEKIVIEVDPVKNTKGPRDIEKNTESLIQWCKAFWNSIFVARTDCPIEVRRIFAHCRDLVEEHYSKAGVGPNDLRHLPLQAVSSIAILRFIVPAVLDPWKANLLFGRANDPARRTLMLIGKTMQNIANLSTVAKEQYMRPLIPFVHDQLHSALEYLDFISTAPSGSRGRGSIHNTRQSDILQTLQHRVKGMKTLDREAIVTDHHALDMPRQLAMIGSAIIRNSSNLRQRTRAHSVDDIPLEELCEKCFNVEEAAVRRVSKLAGRPVQERRPSIRIDRNNTLTPAKPRGGNRLRKSSRSPAPSPTGSALHHPSRPSTAPPTPGLDRAPIVIASLPSSPVFSNMDQAAAASSHTNQPSSPRRAHGQSHHVIRSASVDSVSRTSHRTHSSTAHLQDTSDPSDEPNKRKGLFRSILKGPSRR